MARITRFPVGEGKLPVLPPSDYDPLPGLEEALRTLDDLLRLLDCARARGEDLTGSPVFSVTWKGSPTRSATFAMPCASGGAHKKIGRYHDTG